MNIRTIVTVVVLSLLIGAGVTFGAVKAWPDSSSSQPVLEAAAATPTTNATGGTASGQPAANGTCLTAAQIYQQLRPSVVEIDVTSGGNTFGQQSQAEGSGVVIDQQGDILTNFHVAGNATTLDVKFADGSTASAHFVGGDQGDDLAVIQVDGSGTKLTPATLGDSSALRVGDPVVAIGNPFHLEATLTAGIVSGTGRTFEAGGGSRPIPNMIQTDAPVNPGNSGGPLVDCQGKVIGIVSALENPTGQAVNVGIGFAVPSNTAQSALPGMLAGQTVAHPWLGIAGEDVNANLQQQLNLSVSSGVYVLVVTPGSPAEQAGLAGAFASQSAADQSTAAPTGGDVITKIDGQDVTSIQQLASYINTKSVGDSVALSVVHDGSTHTIQTRLAPWPNSQG